MSWVESCPYAVKKGQRYINLNPGRDPKKERDPEAYLNYYASAYNRGRFRRQLSHRKTKQNQILQNNHASLTKNVYNMMSTQKLKPSSVASYDIWPRNGVGVFW